MYSPSAQARAAAVPSALPEVFGPRIWWTLHATASAYPRFPDARRRAGCISFVGALPEVLPCPACGEHLREEIEKHDIGAACANGASLSRFWCDVHNAVNRRTGKVERDCATVQADYAYVLTDVDLTTACSAGTSARVHVAGDQEQLQAPQCLLQQ